MKGTGLFKNNFLGSTINCCDYKTSELIET